MPTYVWQSDQRTFWRERILFAICLIASVLGPFALIPSLILAGYERRWDIIVIDLMAYCTAVAILICRHLPLNIRAWAACAILYLFGIALLFMLGPTGAGYIWLFGASVMVGGIIGLKAAIWSLLLNFLALTSVAVYIAAGSPVWALPIENAFEKWVVMTANFILFNSLVAIAIAIMLGGLERALLREQEVSNRLRQSEERFRSLFEHSNDAIWVHNLDGRILEVNHRAVEMLQHDIEQVTNAPISRFYPESECKIFQDAFKRILKKGHARFESNVARSDGSIIAVEISSRITNRDKGIVQAIIRDTTERNLLQAQLQQAQKMEAIGRLAGGVAHDFNNLLSIIIGNAELLIYGLKKGDPLYGFATDIIQGGQRGASLTRQLLAFSRKQVVQPEVVDLDKLLTGMEKMLHRLIKEDIELKVIKGSLLGHVKVDPGQMEQVIMNLVVNASDAMPKGGKLNIEIANVEIDESHFQEGITHKRTDSHVMLRVTDTGIGMDKEIQSQIFDPFFTTKRLGEGTGLGLSTVYGIIKQAGGFIAVESEPGSGTSIKVYLPEVEKSEAPPAEIEKRSGELRGSETILIVEDEDRLRKLALKVLRKYGYNAKEAENSREALRIIKERKGLIHLLLTDVVMPDMSGPELVGKITSVQPEIKVLYMSGYTDDAIVHHGVLEPGVNFIEKPFSTEGLVQKVREVLDK